MDKLWNELEGSDLFLLSRRLPDYGLPNCVLISIEDPRSLAYWSSVLNSSTIKLNPDGSFTAHFGSRGSVSM